MSVIPAAIVFAFVTIGEGVFHGAAIDRDGKLVAVGYTADQRALIVRFGEDGTVERTIVERFGERDRLLAVAIDDENRIVVAGKTSRAPKKWLTLLARFGPNGARDFVTINAPFSGSRFKAAHPDERFNAVAAGRDRICAAGVASEISRAWFEGPWFTRAPWFYRGLIACFSSASGALISHEVLATPPGAVDHHELTAIEFAADGALHAAGWAALNLDYTRERTLDYRAGAVTLGGGGSKDVLYDFGVGFSFDAENQVHVLVDGRVEPRGAFTGASVEYAAAGAYDSRKRRVIAGFSSAFNRGEDYVERPILARYIEGTRDPSVGPPPDLRGGFFDVVVDARDRIYAVGVSENRPLAVRLDQPVQ